MAASIILAAVVGGVIFVLLDSWQRRAATASPAMPRSPEPARAAAFQAPAPRPVTPVEPRPRPTWERPDWDHDDRWDDQRPGNLWSGWADREKRS